MLQNSEIVGGKWKSIKEWLSLSTFDLEKDLTGGAEHFSNMLDDEVYELCNDWQAFTTAGYNQF